MGLFLQSRSPDGACVGRLRLSFAECGVVKHRLIYFVNVAGPSRVNQQYEYDDTCREYEEIATINRPAVAHQAATIVAVSSVEQQLAAQVCQQ